MDHLARVFDALRLVETPAGREHLAAALRREPFPHYGPAPGSVGVLVRVEADGARVVGRFVNRRFIAG